MITSMLLMPGQGHRSGPLKLAAPLIVHLRSSMESFTSVPGMGSCMHLMLQQVHNCGLAALEIRFSPLQQWSMALSMWVQKMASSTRSMYQACFSKSSLPFASRVDSRRYFMSQGDGFHVKRHMEAITLRTYSHLLPSQQQEVVKTWNEVFREDEQEDEKQG